MNKPFEDKDKLSERELEILNYISDHAPVTVREVAKNWGEPNGKARTTVLTFIQRLEKKGYLVRERGEDEATAHYRPATHKPDLMRGLVQDFVQNTLGGSVAPFVAYLAESPDLSEEEIAELRRLAEQLGNR